MNLVEGCPVANAQIEGDKIHIIKGDARVTLDYDELRYIMEYARTEIKFKPDVIEHIKNDKNMRETFDCAAILANEDLLWDIAIAYEKNIEADLVNPKYMDGPVACMHMALRENADGLELYRLCEMERE